MYYCGKPERAPHKPFTRVCCWIPYITIAKLEKKYLKRSPTQGRTPMASFTGTFHRLCTWSFRECRRHHSSWEVSRESQSSPLRFFVESIATDHQKVSSFFSEKKSVHWRIRTRDLEPRNRLTDHPATVTYLILVCYVHYLYLPLVYKLKKNGENRVAKANPRTRITQSSRLGLKEPSLKI